MFQTTVAWKLVPFFRLSRPSSFMCVLLSYAVCLVQIHAWANGERVSRRTPVVENRKGTGNWTRNAMPWTPTKNGSLNHTSLMHGMIRFDLIRLCLSAIEEAMCIIVQYRSGIQNYVFFKCSSETQNNVHVPSSKDIFLPLGLVKGESIALVPITFKENYTMERNVLTTQT
jgi:hypothetical protein